MVPTPKARSSLHDLGYIHNETSSETVVFECNPLENSIFTIQRKSSIANEEIRANLECSGSVLVERKRDNGAPSDTLIHYHILKDNRVVLFENNLTQSLSEQSPSVTLTLSQPTDVAPTNRFLNIFYINTLNENVFIVFGSSCWLNVVTFKNYGEKTLFWPLLNCNSFNFRGDRLYFHAGRKVSKLPNQNTDHVFGNELVIDVIKAGSTYKMAVVDTRKNKVSFYVIGLDQCNDLVLTELPNCSYQHQGFAHRSITSIMSFITRQPSVIAVAQVNNNKIVLLHSDHSLVVYDYFADGNRDEFYKETLCSHLKQSNQSNNYNNNNNNTSVSFNHSTNPMANDFSRSFIKMFHFGNHIQVIVHHCGFLYIYRYVCDEEVWYVSSAVDCRGVIRRVMDCIVVPTATPAVKGSINGNSISQDTSGNSALWSHHDDSSNVGGVSRQEYAFVLVGTAENDQLCYYCSYFQIRQRQSSMEMAFVSSFDVLENTFFQTTVGDDINKLASIFTSVDEIHSYYLFKIFSNSTIEFDSIVGVLERYSKSYGAINSAITHDHNSLLTATNIKSVLVEIVENEIASKFGGPIGCFATEATKSLGNSSCLLVDTSQKCSPCDVALQVWQRIYMTILTANAEIASSVRGNVASHLHYYSKYDNGYVISTYDLCGLRVFGWVDSFKLLKKNSYRRHPSNEIFDCCSIVDIPDRFVVFKNLQHLTNQTQRMINDTAVMAKNYTNHNCGYSDNNHFKGVMDFFKQLLSNPNTSSSTTPDDGLCVIEIDKEHIEEVFSLFQLFVRWDGVCKLFDPNNLHTGDQSRLDDTSSLDRRVGIQKVGDAAPQHQFEKGYCILSKIFNAHLNSLCWRQFLITSQLLMLYYNVLEPEIECDFTLLATTTNSLGAAALEYKAVVQQLHVLFNFYGQCFKLCTDWMCARSRNSISSTADESLLTVADPAKQLCNQSRLSDHRRLPTNELASFTMQSVNEMVLDGCHGVKLWASSFTPMAIVCANYVGGWLSSYAPTTITTDPHYQWGTIQNVIGAFFTSSVAEWLYNSFHYEQNLFHCYSMVALWFQIRCMDGGVCDTAPHLQNLSTNTSQEGGVNQFSGHVLQLQLYIARSLIKLHNYPVAKIFYQELLLNFIHLLSQDQITSGLSKCDDEFFGQLLDCMISDFSEKPTHSHLLLDLINIGLSAPVFNVCDALESTHIDVTAATTRDHSAHYANEDASEMGIERGESGCHFIANPTYNKLLQAKFMCHIRMADYRAALDLLSLFYCDMRKKIQKVSIICCAIMESEGKHRLVDVNFNEFLPLVESVLKQMIVDVSSHDSIINYGKQSCEFCIALKLHELAGFFCATAYYKLYDGCLLRYWSVERKTIEAMTYFSHTLRELVNCGRLDNTSPSNGSGVCLEPVNTLRLPLTVSHDEPTIQTMINEFHITPKTIITKDDVEQMVIFCDTCLAIENKLKTLQFLPGSFPVVSPVEMVKYLVKYNMFDVAFKFSFNNVDLLQYVLNAVALHEINSYRSDCGGELLPLDDTSLTPNTCDFSALQKYCYECVANHKQLQLLCNLVRVFLAKQGAAPEWLEHLIAKNNIGKLIQTYLLELRLDKAAQWCVSLLDGITSGSFQSHQSQHTVNSYFYLAELTLCRLEYLVKNTNNPSDAITMNVLLDRLTNSIRNYKKSISTPTLTSDITFSNANIV